MLPTADELELKNDKDEDFEILSQVVKNLQGRVQDY